WWLIAIFFAASVAWVFLVVSNWTIAIAAGVVTAVPLAVGLWQYGSLKIEVVEGSLLVGPATLESRFVGEATALSSEELRHTMGVGADARTFIRTRPYVRTGVLVSVNDSRDSTPYWLVSSRNPDDLVASLNHSGKDHREPIGE
ncbi:MAG: DUF3093 domain-containing protein, partial [Aeromicrobium sp.]